MKHQLHPPPESGVHSWLYGRAAYLRREGLDQCAAFGELHSHVAASLFRPGRSVTEREIIDAIESAFRSTVSVTGPRQSKVNDGTAACGAGFSEATGWPTEMPLPRNGIDRPRLDGVLAAERSGLVDLWEASPVRPPDHPAPQWAVSQLFVQDELLCVGTSSASFSAKTLQGWTDAELLTRQLIVPNPLRKRVGRTKAGNESAHCRDATGPRRFIIVESDAGLDLDEQARVLAHLRAAARGRLAAVVLSGGKSVHGWFRCDGVPVAKLHRWFAYAVSIGADPHLWLPEQFVRLPDGLRENGARQNLIFLDPSA